MPNAHIGDIEINHEIQGHGPPLLLVAGTGYPGATWPKAFVEPLTRHATVITYDHRGTGSSTAGTGPYSTRLFASDAVALLRELGLESAHVLGHSMGGRVAQWMALDAPDSIRSLILAASGPGQYRPDRPLTRGIPVVTAQSLIELGYEKYMADHIEETFFTADFASSHPDVVQSLVRSFWEHRPSLRDYLEHITARQQHQTAERLGGDHRSLPRPGRRPRHRRARDWLTPRTESLPRRASSGREARGAHRHLPRLHLADAGAQCRCRDPLDRRRRGPMTLLLSEEDVRAALDMREAIDALDLAFRALEAGDAVNRPRSHSYTRLPDGSHHLFKTMDGAVLPLGIHALRLSSDLVSEQRSGSGIKRVKLPAAPGGRYVGLVLLFSIDELAPVAIMPDGYLQRMRVGATSALAARHLARPGARTAAIIGTGWQAGAQLLGLAVDRTLEAVRVFGPTPEHVDSFVAEHSSRLDLEITVAEDTRRADRWGGDRRPRHQFDGTRDRRGLARTRPARRVRPGLRDRRCHLGACRRDRGPKSGAVDVSPRARQGTPRSRSRARAR